MPGIFAPNVRAADVLGRVASCVRARIPKKCLAPCSGHLFWPCAFYRRDGKALPASPRSSGLRTRAEAQDGPPLRLRSTRPGLPRTAPRHLATHGLTCWRLFAEQNSGLHLYVLALA